MTNISLTHIYYYETVSFTLKNQNIVFSISVALGMLISSNWSYYNVLQYANWIDDFAGVLHLEYLLVWIISLYKNKTETWNNLCNKEHNACMMCSLVYESD